MRDLRPRMKCGIIAFSAALLVVLVACNNPAGPDPEPTPGGTVVAWFNGLGYTVDLYFPTSDSLVNEAYITGQVPNDILVLEDGEFAVLSSISALLQVFDSNLTGEVRHQVELPSGSNPWAMAQGDGVLWITLLLHNEIRSVSLDDWSIGEPVQIPQYPYGIAVAEGKIFVSHGDYWPDTTAGGVTVLDETTHEQLGWIDTGRNTMCLWLSPESGMIHAFSTTNTDDGVISIISPTTSTLEAQISTGGSPQSPVYANGSYISCDGFGSDVYFYNESGALLSTWMLDPEITIGGITFFDGKLYATDFVGDRVLVADPVTRTVEDTLSAGDGPQGVTVIQR